MKPSPFDDALREVMGDPGKWAKIAEGEARSMHGKAQSLRKKSNEHRLPGQDKGDYQFTVRQLPTGDGKAGVWVMYKTKGQK